MQSNPPALLERRATCPKAMWNGDYGFLLHNLIAKDFKVRYRNMSLGMFWSLLNPLVTMGVLTVVFTNFLPNPAIPHFPLFFLCGLVPYNFFAIAWSTGTSSLSDNAHLIKRVPVPREIIPIATVLGNSLHLMIQIALLLTFAIIDTGVNHYWAWLPLIWIMEVVLLCGLSLISSAVNVYVRDTRYLVESFNAVLFWLVPIVYQFPPPKFRPMFELNPVAALVMALRNILMDGKPPAASLLANLSLGSFAVLALGWVLFRRMKPGFYDYL